MKTFYEPTKLKENLEKVKKKHPFTDEEPTYKPDQSFLEAVKSWAREPEEDVESLAYAIPLKQILQLVDYLITNSLKLPEKNLIRIVCIRLNIKVLTRIAYDWSNYYTSKTIRALYIDAVQSKPELVKQMLHGTRLTIEILNLWLKSDNTVILVGQTAIQLRVGDEKIEDVLKLLYLSTESVLCKRCIEAFYLYCGRMDYLKLKDIDLKRILERYEPKNIKIFVLNFLSVMQITDFRMYYQTGIFLRDRYTKNSGTTAFIKYFAGVPEQLVQKYRKWLTYLAVVEGFGRDKDNDRADFWSKYVPLAENAYIEHGSESFIMIFENYVIIEFLDVGPVYIYHRKDFENSIRGWTKYQNNQTLRHNLYTDTYGYVARIVHNGNWKANVRAKMNLKNIV